MKLFFKILAILLALFIVILVGLNLYFTDERLRDMILPQIRQSTGSDVQVDRMSVTFLRTFPRFGVELDGIMIPDLRGEPVVSADEILASIELFPLFRNEISLARLSVSGPSVFYTVFADSTTNIDFLMEADEADNEEGGYNISVPLFTLQDASVFYRDETSHTVVSLEDLDADVSLYFADLIESRVDATLGALNISVDDTPYLSNLALSLNQTSTIDLEEEVLTFTEGTVAIRGLGLNLTGSVADWSSGEPDLSLQFSSASENFGELLRLAPPDVEEYLAGLETRGSLVLNGTADGKITEETLPRFDLTIDVANGFLQNPDLPEAIEDIHFQLLFNNDLATVNNFRARAGDNRITASGTLERPLDEDAVFSLDLEGDIDLATVGSFYPIEESGLEELAGQLETAATANGQLNRPEDATFSGNFHLTGGLLKYAGVPRAIEQINARLDATQDRIRIDESGFTAADNRFSLAGTIERPLDENQRTVDVRSNINFDLATIRDFYPIDEDTLAMRGKLVADIALLGRPDPDQIETVLQQSTVELSGGYLAHRSLSNPIEEITFRAEANGRRLVVSEARFKAGENALSMNGTIQNYLSDNPVVDLNFDGNAVFGSITTYYSMEPWISELTGNAMMKLNTRGPVNDISAIALEGFLEVNEVTAAGDSLPLPVTDLSGRMNITPREMTLERFSMMYGSSDIELEGSLRRYMAFLDENSTPENSPSISGSYRSRHLNLDEMIDWEEESDDEPVPVHLPNLTASVDAAIDRLTVLGLSVTNLRGNGRLTPERITIENAEAAMFDGTATGRMDWNVPDPVRTQIVFDGKLDSLKAETFFRDTGFLGRESTLHEYLAGEFSTEINYTSLLNANLEPDITTTVAGGTFGMSRARMSGHPIQRRLAEFLNTSELNNLTLDEWTAGFTIRDSVMTLRNVRLTSGNLGIELEGTLHMISDRIDYKATLLLPERFKRGIATVISTRAADALQLEDGRMAVPVRITGTTATPQIRPDTETVDRIVRDYVQDGARNVLRRLFDN